MSSINGSEEFILASHPNEAEANTLAEPSRNKDEQLYMLFDSIYRCFEEEVARADTAEARRATASAILEGIEQVDTEKIAAVAAAVNVSVSEWVVAQLQHALQELPVLPVAPDIYALIKERAYCRNQSMAEFCDSTITPLLLDCYFRGDW